LDAVWVKQARHEAKRKPAFPGEPRAPTRKTAILIDLIRFRYEDKEREVEPHVAMVRFRPLLSASSLLVGAERPAGRHATQF